MLRTAGLVASRRDGKMVMYALTDPGRALLDVVLAQVPARVTELPMLPMAPEPVDAPRAPRADGARRFRVEGMDCASCARTVEKAVAALDGVRAAEVSFGTATMLVDGDGRPASA